MHTPLTKARVQSLQARLNELGYGPLTVDGVYGQRTQAAYRRYLDEVDPDTPTVIPEAAKPWWSSRTLLGLVASAMALIVSRWGWQVDGEHLTQLLTEAVQFGGLVLAFWGTVRRAGPIDRTLVARVGDRDLRLPVRAERAAAADDPRGAFRDS